MGRRTSTGVLSATLLWVAGCATGPDAPADEPWFREAAAETGLNFEYFVGASGDYFLPEIMGSGVALFDYDADGDLDVYLLQGTMIDPDAELSDSPFPPPEKNWPGCRLYRNELVPSGELRFVDVTAEAGMGYPGYGYGAAVADYDADGDLDLYVTAFGPNVFYRNDGDGTFTDITREAGVTEDRWSISATFLDYDRDDDLDLFVVNYTDFSVSNNKDCYDPTGARDYCNPAVFNPLPDRLFRNNGDGGFTDVSVSAGIGAAFGSGLGVTAADVNLDGWIDLVVANDGNANQVWENQRDGSFEDIGLMSGVSYNAHGRPEASMGITLGDFDADGDEDIFVAHLARETNTLYVNDGTGIFEDATDRAGLGSPSYMYTGFGSHWFDYDHDGWLDLFIVNGAVTIAESQRGSPFPFRQKTLLFRGLGEGRFEEVSERAGPGLQLEEASRGAAFGDVDNDGDIDVAVNNANGPAHLFLNQVGNRNPSLIARLEQDGANREALGARIAVLPDTGPPMWRRVHRDGSFASSNDVRVHFGLGGASSKGVGVIWPDGAREIFRHPRAGEQVTLKKDSGDNWDDVTP